MNTLSRSTHAVALVFALTLLAIPTHPASSTQITLTADPVTSPIMLPRSDTWITNGPVHALAMSGTTLYLGGTFSSIGPPTGGFASIDGATGQSQAADISFPVHAIAADGAGSWFITGACTYFTPTCLPLAHILPNGGIDPAWSADVPPAGVLAVAPDALYVAQNISPYRVQRFDIATGEASAGPWLDALSVNTHTTEVLGIKIADNRLIAHTSCYGIEITPDPYACGQVTMQALPPAEPDVWVVEANGPIEALVIDAGVVYIGGAFTTVSGQPRAHLAALDLATGALLPWSASADATVRALVLSTSSLFAGGDFSTVSGEPRAHLAALDPTTGALLPWNPGASAAVSAMALGAAGLYIGGDFTVVAGQPRSHLAALDPTTGTVLPWNPGANRKVGALAFDGSRVGVGGGFSSIGGVPRANLAAIDLTTGAATAWDPGADGPVHALAVGSTGLYAGGAFSHVDGQARANIAEIDHTTGAATSWDPGTDGPVYALATSGEAIYIGGRFSQAGGQLRTSLAAFDTATDTLLPWSPSVAGTVYALAPSADTIYVGGAFTDTHGHANVVALDAVSGVARQWAGSTSGPTYALALGNETLYVGGAFCLAGGVVACHLAALDSATGRALLWGGWADQPVYALSFDHGSLYVGGAFTQLGRWSATVAHPLFGVLDSMTGEPIAAPVMNFERYPWQENPASRVHTVMIADRVVAIGGDLHSASLHIEPVTLLEPAPHAVALSLVVR